MSDLLKYKGRLLKYRGSDYILGEIVKDNGFYWLVHPMIGQDKRGKDKQIDPHRVVCHPKWSTEIKRGGLAE